MADDASAPTANADDVASAFHVANPAVDATALAERVRRGLAERAPLDVDVSTLLVTFGSATFLPSPDDPAYHVVQLGLLAEHRIPSDRIRPPEGRLGAAIDRVRAPFHQLVRFYVDAHADRMDQMARHTIEVLRHLLADRDANRRLAAEGVETWRARLEAATIEAHASRALIDALARDVTDLRAEVAALRGARQHADRSAEGASDG